MSMSPEDVKKSVEYVVHQVFVPKLNQQIAIFLKKYEDNITLKYEMSRLFGRPVRNEPLKMDISQPLEELVNNITAFQIITKQPEKQNDPEQSSIQDH